MVKQNILKNKIELRIKILKQDTKVKVYMNRRIQKPLYLKETVSEKHKNRKQQFAV